MTSQTVVERMRRRRNALGLSGAAIGLRMAELGVPWNCNTVAKLETGRRASINVDELVALAKVLGVDVADLVAPLEADDSDSVPRTPDDVASYNLAVAREWRGWTQQEAAERVSCYLGKPLSVESYAAAERAHRGSRGKEFSVTELVAFSRAFNLPFGWWFLPRSPGARIVPRGTRTPDGAAISGVEMLSYLAPLGEQLHGEANWRGFAPSSSTAVTDG